MTVRNILLIMADDLGSEWLVPEFMPNLCRIAAQGTQFVNCVSMGLCTPSRATLLTGRYPWETGIAGHINYDDTPDAPGLAETGLPTWFTALRDASVRTLCAGKWQFRDPIHAGRMRSLGLDEWLVWSAHGATGNRYTDDLLWSDNRGVDGTAPDGWSEDAFMSWLVESMVLNRRVGDRFAAYYPMHLPHDPIVQPPGQPDASRESMVRDADRRIGALVELIATTALREETLVLITSDNGTAGVGKGLLTDAGVNVPLVAWGAGVSAGLVSDQMIDFTDFFPTIEDLMDVGGEYDGFGLSFAHVLRGELAPSWARQTALSSGLGILKPREDGLFRVNPEARTLGAYRDRFGLIRTVAGETFYDRTTGKPVDPAGRNAYDKLREALDGVPEDRALGPVEGSI